MQVSSNIFERYAHMAQRISPLHDMADMSTHRTLQNVVQCVLVALGYAACDALRALRSD